MLAGACTRSVTESAANLGESDVAFGFRVKPDSDEVVTKVEADRLADLIKPLDDAQQPTSSGPRLVPIALSAPTIGVASARISRVGVDDTGFFAVPERDEVGWYKFGPAPGEDGSSVLAAHISQGGIPGVFELLRDMKAGHTVTVEFNDGSAKEFVVLGLVQYDKEVLPIEELFDRNGPPSLVLITCGGDFNPQLRSYDDNIIVYAVETTQRA